MSLSEVHITDDAYFTCITHALTTEKEEVMGLLIGDTELTNKGTIAHIFATSVLIRSDKRKDRVEISPEQLTAGMAEADKIKEQLKKETRVIGWYHSHPHITVNPSHVDIQTQAMYQLLDKGFIGLIFSCFNKDQANTSGRIQVTAFQSLTVNSKETKLTSTGSKKVVDLIDLNDSPKQDEDSFLSKSKSTDGRQECVEVPLKLIQSPVIGPNTLEKIYVLQEILYGEEKSAYLNAIKPQDDEKTTHPLVQIHSTAVFQKSLSRLLETETLPVLALLQQRHKLNLEKIKQLKEEKKRLELQVRNKKAKT